MSGILGAASDGREPVSERELKLELLLDLGEMIAREVELDDLLARVADRVAAALGADRSTVWLVDAATGELVSRVAVLPELDALSLPIGRGVAGYVAREVEAVNIRDASTDERWAPEVDQRTGYRTTSMLCVPIVDHRRLRGVVQVLNKREGAFTDRDEAFLTALAAQIARALEYTTLRPDDSPRGVPLRGPFNHIVGSSPVMEAVYENIFRAAGTDATVLLRGETGTGKGLLSRAIHVNSARRSGPFVAIDCTTLPAALVESELFGHERGAYTGADRRVVGKVELADGGTLFLDELGELPIALQGKFLRFLQERRYERVGGRATLAADVRIVAATNRDLEELVAAGRFRSDLYYRVRVIDIEVPPLRARGDGDLLSLAEHFLGLYRRRYEKPASRLSEEARAALAGHTWPGNVRELEHAIERAVVLSGGEVIDADALGLRSAGPVAARRQAPAEAETETETETEADPETVSLPRGLALEEASRRYAAAALEQHGGNRSATARVLGISRNRLSRLLARRE